MQLRTNQTRPFNRSLLLGSEPLSRRRLIRGAGFTLTGAGAAVLFGCGGGEADGGSKSAKIPDRLETTRLRLQNDFGTCTIPIRVAADFLQAEGFTEVEYVAIGKASDVEPAMSAGTLDIGVDYAAPIVSSLDAGRKFVVLAGMHGGCLELFVNDNVENIGDLRGKTIAVSLGNPNASDYAFSTTILRFIGIGEDVKLVQLPINEILTSFSKGKVDAVMTSPPLNLQLRDLGFGRVILNSMVDRPWSQYYCCMVLANADFVKTNPGATKRALRAILKAVDACSQDPQRAAKAIVDWGGVLRADYALEIAKSMPYDVWRRYSPEDSLRFYALRLKEAGQITSTPDQIIANGTDWRFLNELKQELAYAPSFSPSATAYNLNCASYPSPQLGPPTTTDGTGSGI